MSTVTEISMIEQERSRALKRWKEDALYGRPRIIGLPASVWAAMDFATSGKPKSNKKLLLLEDI